VILDIKVIRTDGSSISWKEALLRYIGFIISTIPLFLGFIWIFFDSKRQGWPDKIASTYVVQKNTQFSSKDTVTFVRPTLTARQHIQALMVSGSPIILGYLIFVVDPMYIKRLFTFSCDYGVTSSDLCTQPLDWIMGGMIVPLVSIGYFGIRGTMTLLRGPKRIVMGFVIFVLFVLPAIYIVLLGPATLVILGNSSFGQ
jgi:hypothetical protein